VKDWNLCPLVGPDWEVQLCGTLSHKDPWVFLPASLLEQALETEVARQFLLLGHRTRDDYWTSITVTSWENWSVEKIAPVLPGNVVGLALFEVTDEGKRAGLIQVQMWASTTRAPLALLCSLRETEARAITVELSAVTDAVAGDVGGFLVYRVVPRPDLPETKTTSDEAKTIPYEIEGW
jgi:hypothetical protein